MKVISYAPSIHSGGGTERLLVNLSNEFTKFGIKFQIFSQNIGNNKVYDLNESIVVKQLLFDKIAQRFKHFYLFKILNKIFGGLLLQLDLNRNIES